MSHLQERITCCVFGDCVDNAFFHDLERKIFWPNLKARPHYGKYHTMKAAQMADRFERFEDFLKMRAVADPRGVFLNDYVERLLLK